MSIDGERYDCTADEEAVATDGGGACAYQLAHLFFSAPDGGDPRSDGRRYAVIYPVEAHPYLISAPVSLAIIFMLLAIAGPQKRWFVIGGAIGSLGAALLLANIVGCFIPLRHPDIGKVAGQYDPGDVTLSYAEALELLERRPRESAASYATRATLTVSSAMMHDWNSEHFVRYRVNIPIWENWALHFLGLTATEARDYVFWDSHKALERGVGLCGHVSSLLVGLLQEQGIDARVFGLFGHVVVTAEVAPGEWHVLDPDFGLVIPFSVHELSTRPDVVRVFYEPVVRRIARPVAWQDAMLDRLVSYYGNTTQHSEDPSGRLGHYSAWASPAEWYGRRERLTYQSKWPVPLIRISLGAAAAALGRRRGRRQRWSAHGDTGGHDPTVG